MPGDGKIADLCGRNGEFCVSVGSVVAAVGYHSAIAS